MTALLAMPVRPTRYAGPPAENVLPWLRPISVAEYGRMIECGILGEDDRVELLDGLLVTKMGRDPAHDGTVEDLRDFLATVVPSGWRVRSQTAVTLATSQPEPDIAVVRRDPGRYRTHHPTSADIAIVAEVANTSLGRDRDWKGSIYARAGIAQYWLVNVVDRQIELFTEPGPAGYLRQRDYADGESFPIVIDGATVGEIAVGDLLPVLEEP